MAFEEEEFGINICEHLSEVADRMLLEAELLMEEIEELISFCVPTNHSNQRQHTMIQQEELARIQEDGETLVIEGFRFESAASREELQRLNPQSQEDGARATHD